MLSFSTSDWHVTVSSWRQWGDRKWDDDKVENDTNLADLKMLAKTGRYFNCSRWKSPPKLMPLMRESDALRCTESCWFPPETWPPPFLPLNSSHNMQDGKVEGTWKVQSLSLDPGVNKASCTLSLPYQSFFTWQHHVHEPHRENCPCNYDWHDKTQSLVCSFQVALKS